MDGSEREMPNEPVKNRQGGQPGNRNAWKHGRRSAAATLRRKRTYAVLKAATHLLSALGGFPRGQEPRCRPLRPDQLALLIDCEPVLAAFLLRVESLRACRHAGR
jgi:hypothetical protein